jgi:hypothetical protein
VREVVYQDAAAPYGASELVPPVDHTPAVLAVVVIDPDIPRDIFWSREVPLQCQQLVLQKLVDAPKLPRWQKREYQQQQVLGHAQE